VFLPPLLYWSGFFASPRELRADLRTISLLAVGLVLATMGAVAVTAHALIHGLPWAAAFALGAIVSPTDPLAATAIARRLGVPRRLVTLVEGESLVNDATALVAYRIAVAAAVGGGFVAWQAGLRFVAGAVGGVAIGLLVGWLVAEVRRRLDDPPVEIMLSLATGYAAYLPADRLGVSGVLAAVTAGLYVGWRNPEIASAPTRLLGFSFWDVLVFLVNAILFILIGLQLHPILSGISGHSAATLLGLAAAVSAAVVATDAALARLEELAAEDWTGDDTVERLRGTYDLRRRRLKAQAGKIEDDGYEDRSRARQRLVRELLQAQRHAIVQLRNQGAVSNDVMHRIERHLDLEDSRLEI
jgi:Na+/H+ antiporter